MPSTKYQLPERKDNSKPESTCRPSLLCAVNATFNNPPRHAARLASGLHDPDPERPRARLPRRDESEGTDSPIADEHGHIAPFTPLQVSPCIRKRLLRPCFPGRHSEEAGSPCGLVPTHLAAQTRLKACPRLQCTAVQLRSPRMRGAGGAQCRHMGACTRARTHTHTPNYLRDGDSRCGLAGRAVTLTQGAGKLCKAVSFPPATPTVSFNGKTTAEL